jgi:DNA repair protein RadC
LTPAIKYCAASLILVHNHPSNNPKPSPEDIGTTKRLVEASKIIGINILDHIIITDDSYHSMKSEKDIDFLIPSNL